MKNSKLLVSFLSIFAVVFGLTLSGCSQKSEEEKALDDAAGQMEDAAKSAEKDAAKLKEEAEKALPNH
ncbi:hypothetical protein [Pelagicoccus albus]|uniref:Lipoprotein n=1 Tax=Pelagicoccus albus TaxID=415222 RepID=A0A7X1B6A9_9BACT|nr:hypothetical protein [Pelagicoccus albus]MBC2606451.1 hypothetical protein [Pelagicoccus albus]